MNEQFARSEAIFGTEAMEKLKHSHVAVFGIGGVGGYAVEALARGGVGALSLIDSDTVSVTNINRQIIALHSTVGQYKTEVAAARARDINPEIIVHTHNVFFTPDTASDFDFSVYDYVIDAVDTVAAKIALVMRAKEYNVPIISAMGAGNKLDPTAFTVADIYKTTVCPLARVMRRELKARGVRRLKVVYSTEEGKRIDLSESEPSNGRHPPASTSFVPGVMGLILAGEVIKDLAAPQNEN
ncbi:MAG: tRNA threonylcarbamoyladenosine dehydratase [Clostridia bacterium]|nr:tRNA threonylcarbamoyladenosine dehydratase [Clostridia bacterium]